jgi:hypothetical protein
MLDTPTEKLDTREDAVLIVNDNEKFEFVALLFFWSEVLSSINRIQTCLQAEETTFTSNGNFGLIDNRKNELCVKAICDAVHLFNKWTATVSRRIKKILLCAVKMHLMLD